MARALYPPFEYGKVEGVPIIITVKDVKNYNMRFSKDKINISVPPHVSQKEVDKVIQKWMPKIHEGLAHEKEQYLFTHDGKKIYISFDSYDGSIKASALGEDVIVHFPNTSYNVFDRKTIKAIILENLSSLLAEAQFDRGDYTNLKLSEVKLYGKNYKVKYQNRSKIEKDDSREVIFFPSHFKDVEEEIHALDKFLVNELQEFTKKILAKWEPIVKKHVRTLTIKPYKSKWASIKPRTADLNLNFYMICTPKICIEATIVHELCHFYSGGHQKDFYDRLYAYFPDYERTREILNNYDLPMLHFKLELID